MVESSGFRVQGFGLEGLGSGSFFRDAGFV